MLSRTAHLFCILPCLCVKVHSLLKILVHVCLSLSLPLSHVGVHVCLHVCACMHVCVRVCAYACVCAYGGREMLDALKLKLLVIVSSLTWVLGTEVESMFESPLKPLITNFIEISLK